MWVRRIASTDITDMLLTHAPHTAITDPIILTGVFSLAPARGSMASMAVAAIMAVAGIASAIEMIGVEDTAAKEAGMAAGASVANAAGMAVKASVVKVVGRAAGASTEAVRSGVVTSGVGTAVASMAVTVAGSMAVVAVGSTAVAVAGSTAAAVAVHTEGEDTAKYRFPSLRISTAGSRGCQPFLFCAS
jgi:hypothetical protein